MVLAQKGLGPCVVHISCDQFGRVLDGEVLYPVGEHRFLRPKEAYDAYTQSAQSYRGVVDEARNLWILTHGNPFDGRPKTLGGIELLNYDLLLEAVAEGTLAHEPPRLVVLSRSSEVHPYDTMIGTHEGYFALHHDGCSGGYGESGF